MAKKGWRNNTPETSFNSKNFGATQPMLPVEASFAKLMREVRRSVLFSKLSFAFADGCHPEQSHWIATKGGQVNPGFVIRLRVKQRTRQRTS